MPTSTLFSFNMRVGALEVDLVTRKAAVDGAGLELTPREFDVLAYLMTLEGDSASRHMLIKQVWKVQSRFTSMENVIDVHMTNLRKKLRGVGYCIPLGEPG